MLNLLITVFNGKDFFFGVVSVLGDLLLAVWLEFSVLLSRGRPRFPPPDDEALDAELVVFSNVVAFLFPSMLLDGAFSLRSFEKSPLWCDLGSNIWIRFE